MTHRRPRGRGGGWSWLVCALVCANATASNAQCVDDAPIVTAVESTAQAGVFRVRGTARALACTEGGTVSFFGAQVVSLQTNCTLAVFQALIDPDGTAVAVCQSGGFCGTGGCADVSFGSLATPTPTRTPTPPPTIAGATATATATRLPTPTPTTAACVSEPPSITQLQFDSDDPTIAVFSGTGRALLCFRAGQLTVFGAQPIDIAITCQTGSFAAAVKLRPDALNTVTLCQRSLCATGGCTQRSIDLRVTTPTPTLSPTPTPCDPLPSVELGFQFGLQPRAPRVGDDAVLSVVVRNDTEGLAGLPTYSLLGVAPYLEVIGAPMKSGVSSLGLETLIYHVRATQAGTAALQMLVTYETADCRINPVPHFESRTSPAFAVNVGVAGSPTPSPSATLIIASPSQTVVPSTLAPPPATPTATSTLTPCISEPPLITTVEPTRELGVWMVHGRARALACGLGGELSFWGARPIAVQPDCGGATFSATVEPQFDRFTICQRGGPCGTGGCVEVTVDAEQATPTPSATLTPITPVPTSEPAATPTATTTPRLTPTPTPTSCVSDGPLLTSVISVSTDPLAVIVQGYSPGLFCFRGGTLSVYGAALASANVMCGNGTFEARVRVEPYQLNTVSFCQRSGVCAAGGCTSLTVDRRRPTPTPTLARLCAGDCDGDRAVDVVELVTAVRIGLGARPVASCRALDADADERGSIDEIVAAVERSLGGCP